MGSEASLVREAQAQADGEVPPRLVLHLDGLVASEIDQALLNPDAEPAPPPWRRTHNSQDKEVLKASVEEDLSRFASRDTTAAREPDPLDADTHRLQPRFNGVSLFATVLLDGEQVKGGRVECFPSAVIELRPQRWTSKVQINFFLSSPSSTSLSESKTLAIQRPRAWSTLSAPVHRLISLGIPLYASLWVGLNSMDERNAIPDIDIEEAVQRAHSSDPNTPKVKITVYKPAADVKIPTSQPSLKSLDRSALVKSETWSARPSTDPDLGGKLTRQDTMPTRSLGGLSTSKASASSASRKSGTIKDGLPHPDATYVLKQEDHHTFGMYSENRNVEPKPLSYEGLQGLIRCLQESNSIADELQKQFTEDPSRSCVAEHETKVIQKITAEHQHFQKMFATAQQKWTVEKMQLQEEADRISRQIDGEVDRHDAILVALNSGHDEEIIGLSDKILALQRSLQPRLDTVNKEHQMEMQLAQSEADLKAEKIKVQVDASRSRFKEEHQDELDRHAVEWERAHQQAWNAKEQALREERERHDFQAFGLQKQMETHKRSIEDASMKKEKLVAKIAYESQELEQESKKTRAELDAQMILTKTTNQSNLRLLRSREEQFATIRQEELRLLSLEIERSKQHRQHLLDEADAQCLLTLQTSADTHVSKIRDASSLATHHLAGVAEEHKTHMRIKDQHLELKKQAHQLQVSNFRASSEKEDEHSAKLEEQIAALQAEMAPLSTQIADLEQLHKTRAEEHGTVIDDLASQISLHEQKTGLHTDQSNQIVYNISEAHAERLSCKSSEHSRVLQDWDSAIQTLSDDLADQQQRAQQRCDDMKNVWEQKYANAQGALQGARERLAKSEARAAEALEERRQDLNRQMQSAEARLSEEVQALKLQLARLTEAGQQETSRLEREIAAAEQDASSVLERISAELEKQLQQHSHFHQVRQQSLTSEHAEQLHQTREANNAALAQLRSTHGAWRDPLQSELERLRKNRIELLEAKQQEHSLTQDITSETALLEAERKANSELTQQSVSKRHEFLSCETELAQVVSELKRVEPLIAEATAECKRLREDHSVAVTTTVAKKETTMSAILRDAEDLRKRINQQRKDSEEMHDSQVQELEVKLIAEKHRLEGQVASLEQELRDARSAADRARMELMGDLRIDLDMVIADTDKALAEVQEEQRTLASLREQAAEEARNHTRVTDATIAKILGDAQEEVSKRRQATHIERRSHLERHEARIKQLQMANDEERQRFERAFADQKRFITELHSKVARKEKEHDDAAAEVTRLRKELNSLETQRERGLKNALEFQSTNLLQNREISEEKQALIQREAQAHQQHLMQQLQIESTNAARFANDLAALEEASGKQRLVASQEAERKRAEITQLKQRLDALAQSHQTEREEISKQLEHAEHRAMLQRSKADGGKSTASHEQVRLERELASLKDRLADEKNCLRSIHQDVESQEQRLQSKLQQELEHQERGFEAQRQSHNTAHRSEASIRQLELRQAAEQCQAGHIAECHRTSKEIAEMESRMMKLEAVSQKSDSLREELSAHQERLREHLQAHQEEMSAQSRQHEEEMAVLKGQHNTKREEETSYFSSSLAKRKQEGKDKSEKILSQIEEARQKASVARQIKHARFALIDTFVGDHSQSAQDAALKQIALEQDDIKKSLEVQCARDLDAIQEKLSDVAVQKRYVMADFERQLAEQQTLQQLQLAEEEAIARREREQVAEKQRALEQQVKAVQESNESMKAALEKEASAHKSQYMTSMSEGPALLEVKRKLRHSQQRLQQQLEECRADMQARIKKVQEDCDVLVRQARLSAVQEASLSTRSEILCYRLELSRAQEEANLWQKRCDVQQRSMEQVSYADSFQTFGEINWHPMQHIANRVIFRLYRALFQEKQSKLSTEELEGVFRDLPRDAEGNVRLSREEFMNMVHRCEDIRRTLLVRQAFRNMDAHQHGEVEEHEFILQPLGLDRDTLCHIFFIMEGAGRTQREARLRAMTDARLRARRAITEDSFVHLFTRTQLPYSESLLIYDEEDDHEEMPRVFTVDKETSDAFLMEAAEISEQRHGYFQRSIILTPPTPQSSTPKSPVDPPSPGPGGQAADLSRDIPSTLGIQTSRFSEALESGSLSISTTLLQAPKRDNQRRPTMQGQEFPITLVENPMHPSQPSSGIATRRQSVAGLPRPSMVGLTQRREEPMSRSMISSESTGSPSKFLAEALSESLRRSPSVSTVDAQEASMSPRLSLFLNRRGTARERRY